MTAQTIPIGITKTVAQDYARRDVFPELRPGQQWFVKKFPAYELYHTLDYKLVFAVLDDAAEQEKVSRGRSGVGITLAYRALARQTLRFLRCDIGFDPSNIFYSVSGREPEFDDSGYSFRPVEDVFNRFGIPLAVIKPGC